MVLGSPENSFGSHQTSRSDSYEMGNNSTSSSNTPCKFFQVSGAFVREFNIFREKFWIYRSEKLYFDTLREFSRYNLISDLYMCNYDSNYINEI
jgi:hypothetical protein